ncbi:hypothetical protein [Rhizobium binxianense]
MTTNLVPHHIFIRHEYEWQALREAAERLEKADRRETTSQHFLHGGKIKPPRQDDTSAIRIK